MRVHAPHLQAHRHTQRDVGRGRAGTGTHVHTEMCMHARSRCTASIAHQLRHTAPTQRTPTQTAFLSLFTHAHPLRPLLLPLPFSWCQPHLPRGAPCTQSWCPSHSLPAAAPSRVAPAALGFPLGAPHTRASFVPRSPWHNQVPPACVNTETTVTGTRCQVGHGGAGEGSACTGSVCACTSVVLCWGGVCVCKGMCSRALRGVCTVH